MSAADPEADPDRLPRPPVAHRPVRRRVMRGDLFAGVDEAAEAGQGRQGRAQRPVAAAAAGTVAAPAPTGASKPAKPPKPKRGAPRTVLVTAGAKQGTSIELGATPITDRPRARRTRLVLDDDYVSARHARLCPHERRLVRRGPRLDQRHLPRPHPASPRPTAAPGRLAGPHRQDRPRAAEVAAAMTLELRFAARSARRAWSARATRTPATPRRTCSSRRRHGRARGRRGGQRGRAAAVLERSSTSAPTGGRRDRAPTRCCVRPSAGPASACATMIVDRARARGHGHDADRAALDGDRGGDRPRRRLPRLPAARRRARAAHPRPDLRAVPGRRGPDQPTRTRATHPQRSLLLRALDGRDEVEPDIVAARAAGRRPLPALQRRPVRRASRGDHRATLLTAGTPDDAVDRLVELALRGGGPDNVTCVVADVVDAADARGADRSSVRLPSDAARADAGRLPVPARPPRRATATATARGGTATGCTRTTTATTADLAEARGVTPARPDRRCCSSSRPSARLRRLPLDPAQYYVGGDDGQVVDLPRRAAAPRRALAVQGRRVQRHRSSPRCRRSCATRSTPRSRRAASPRPARSSPTCARRPRSARRHRRRPAARAAPTPTSDEPVASQSSTASTTTPSPSTTSSTTVSPG